MFLKIILLLLKKIIKANDLKEEKIMVARQAMQDQEIPDFIEHKQIVAVFDLPENITKKFYRNTKKRVLIKYSL